MHKNRHNDIGGVIGLRKKCNLFLVSWLVLLSSICFGFMIYTFFIKDFDYVSYYEYSDKFSDRDHSTVLNELITSYSAIEDASNTVKNIYSDVLFTSKPADCNIKTHSFLGVAGHSYEKCVKIVDDEFERLGIRKQK